MRRRALLDAATSVAVGDENLARISALTNGALNGLARRAAIERIAAWKRASLHFPLDIRNKCRIFRDYVLVLIIR